jgi:FkbM family methyltransferase
MNSTLRDSLSPKLNGIKYIITDKKDLIQGNLVKGEQWNNELFQMIKSENNTKHFKHLLNVGAHIGTMCLPLSLIIPKITAIEAYEPTYKDLRNNIKLNNIRNITTHHIAVGNSSEDIYFNEKTYEDTNRNSGAMQVFTKADILKKERFSKSISNEFFGRIEKLDNLPIDGFDIMVVDIEGYEYDFLLGAKSKILKNKPIIIIEIWGNKHRQKLNMKKSLEDVTNLIISFGYKLIGKPMGDDYVFHPL